MDKFSIIFHENSKQIDLNHFALSLKNVSKLMFNIQNSGDIAY